jgi:hypothetical protein
MNANTQGGARFAWIGGGFRQNGGAGLILDNGTHDVTVKGAYVVDNHGPGIDATSGINTAYQKSADNIVGRMTIAALDREMVLAEFRDLSRNILPF